MATRDPLTGRFPDALSAEGKRRAVELYLDGATCAAAAGEVGCSPAYVRILLRRAGRECRPLSVARRKHELRNEAAFDAWTPEACYWAGFVAADGHLEHRTHGYLVAFTLAARDREQLDGFRAFVGSSLPIRSRMNRNPGGGRTELVSFALSSQRVFDRLAAAGIRPGNESEVIPDLAGSPHFWRGVIDGDGCVRAGDAGYVRAQLWVYGGRVLMGQFADFARTICPDAVAGVHRHKGIWLVTAACLRAAAILEAVYGRGGPALGRKRAAALRAVEAARGHAAAMSAKRRARAEAVCSVPGCGRPLAYRGLCGTCYQRRQRLTRRRP